MMVFIGYDRKEDESFKVARYSILKHASSHVKVFPLIQDSLRAEDYYLRPKDLLASTDFSLTRFLVPYLSRTNLDEYIWSIYCDCDFLFLTDVFKLLEGLDPQKALYVVKHNQVVNESRKMDGQAQIRYPRKNWASFMIMNYYHKAFDIWTPEFINSPKLHIPDLNEFRSIPDEFIGELPLEYNFLVGVYKAPDKEARTLTEPTKDTPVVAHFTLGTPMLCEELRDTDYAKLWLKYYYEYRESKGE